MRHYPMLSEAGRWLFLGAGLLLIGTGADPVRVCGLVGSLILGSAAYSVYAMFRDAGREP